MLNRLTDAIKIAQNIEGGIQHFKIAALAVRKDGALVRSINLPTKDPNPRVHAESRVMLKAGWGSTVYVARVLRNGIPALSRPCADCERLMRARGVKKVYYTIDNDEYGCLNFN